ncbi:unnamed protein product [Parnassius apollo]|uniref:(apollo) hypothetical protein n=1 Tax=Parnassius apollo TaxID=110799 RepID=A0A8S3W0W8_PARAO|nr:unnamed protein product [Parnassius apollo]
MEQLILLPTKSGNYKLQYGDQTFWCNWYKSNPNEYKALRIWYCSKRSGRKCKVYLKTLNEQLILLPTKSGNYKLLYGDQTFWCNWYKSNPNEYKALRIWYCSKRSGRKCKVYMKTLNELILLPTKSGNYKLQYGDHTFWCNWHKSNAYEYKALRIWYCSKRSGKKCRVYLKTLHGSALRDGGKQQRTFVVPRLQVLQAAGSERQDTVVLYQKEMSGELPERYTRHALLRRDKKRRCVGCYKKLSGVPKKTQREDKNDLQKRKILPANGGQGQDPMALH